MTRIVAGFSTKITPPRRCKVKQELNALVTSSVLATSSDALVTSIYVSVNPVNLNRIRVAAACSCQASS